MLLSCAVWNIVLVADIWNINGSHEQSINPFQWPYPYQYMDIASRILILFCNKSCKKGLTSCCINSIATVSPAYLEYSWYYPYHYWTVWKTHLHLCLGLSWCPNCLSAQPVSKPTFLVWWLVANFDSQQGRISLLPMGVELPVMAIRPNHSPQTEVI